MCVSASAAFGHSMLNPSLPVYAANIGIAVDVIGRIMAIALFICMFGRAYMGGCSDRVDNRKLVRISLITALSGYVFLLFANNMPMILIGKTLQATGYGMTSTVLTTLAFSSVPKERLASAIGIFSLSASLAQCFAPNVGTELAYKGLFLPMFMVAIAVTSVSVVLVGFVAAPAREEAKPAKGSFKLSEFICKPAIPAAIMLVFNGIVYSSISSYLSLYGLDRGLARIGLFFTINSITMLVTRPMTGKICDSKPLAFIMVPALLSQVFTCILLARASSMVIIAIAALLYGFGFGSSQAAIQIMAIRSVGAEQRGKANGTFYVGGDIGLSSGSYIAGALAGSVGYTNMYTIMAVIAFMCLVFFLAHIYITSTRKGITVNQHA